MNTPPALTTKLARCITASHLARPFTLVYASTSAWPSPSLPAQIEAVRISILDSSYNPPTRAHLALATQPRISPHTASATSTSSSTEPFHAHLLLLSTKNADKTPGPGETGPVQRLEMMRAMAVEMERLGCPSVAIACV